MILILVTAGSALVSLRILSSARIIIIIIIFFSQIDNESFVKLMFIEMYQMLRIH